MSRRVRIVVALGAGVLLAAQGLSGAATAAPAHLDRVASADRTPAVALMQSGAPAGVTRLQALATGNEVHLSWQPPSATRTAPATSIVIRRVAGTVPVTEATQGQAVVTLPASTRSYVDFVRSSGRYTYSVFSENARGEASAAATARTHVTATARAVPAVITSGGPVITGTVTDSAAAPLGNVVVRAYPAFPYVNFGGVASTGEGGVPTASTTTGSTGTYRLTGLTTGTWQICADGTQAPITGGQYAAAGFEVSCQSVVLRSATVTAPTIALTSGVGGTVTGTVTAAGGTPVAGAQVSEYTYSDYPDSSTTTDAAGHYAIFVSPGPVRICASGGTGASASGYASTCAASATVVHNGTTTVNVTASIGGGVTGTVTAADDGTAVPGAEVELQVAGTEGDWIDQTQTTASGSYTFSGAPSGSYQVCFGASGLVDPTTTPTHPTGFVAQCTGSVTIQSGVVTAAPALQLVTAGAITGSVTASGVGLAGVEVQVEGYYFVDATTDSSGNYAVDGLPSGSYTVCFQAVSYPALCYGATQPEGQGSPVNVTTGVVTAGISGSLSTSAPGSLTVAATDGVGHGIVDVNVVVIGICADSSSFDCGVVTPYNATASVAIWQDLLTSSTGAVTLGSLPPGKYAVCAFTQYASGGVSTTGYANGCSGTKLTITVSAGKLVKYTIKLKAGALVTGTVTDAGGHPVAGVDVQASVPGITDYQEQSQSWYFPLTTTAADGTYRLTGVAAGQATVCFSAEEATGPSKTGYLDQCYQATTGTPTPIVVTSGATTSGINAVLAYSGAVSGKVTDFRGKAVYGADVWVQSEAPGSAGGNPAVTSSTGTYLVRNVPAGTYSVCFSAYNLTAEPANGYTQTCYKNIVGSGTPTPVTVTNGVTSSGISSALHAAAVLKGTVTQGGSPAAYVSIQVFTSLAEDGELYGGTDQDGTWSVTGLSPGTYYVCATSSTGQGVCDSKQTWDPTSSTLPAKSKAITLKSGQTTTVTIALPQS